MNWYKFAQQYATHLTDKDSYEEILKTQKFTASLTGWNGPGLYAHVGLVSKGEGKGDYKVIFDYSQLKLNSGDKPGEISQNKWDNLRSKDNRTIDKVLASLGYDGEIIHGGSYLRIFPESVSKIIPIRENNELV